MDLILPNYNETTTYDGGGGSFLENESILSTNDDYFEGSEEHVSWTLARIQRVITLSILMVVSLVGNLVIILVLTCSRFHKHLSRVNIFIINLAVGDLAVCCITMPTELIFEIAGQNWIFGPYGCKLIMYIQITALSSTTYLLMTMSFDRYQAICRPLDFNPSRSKATKMVAGAWVAALISALPYFFIYLQVQTGSNFDGSPKYSCHSVGYTAEWMKKVNFIWLTCSCYLIPAIWIAFCYFNVARVVWQQGNFQKMETVHGVTLLRKTCDHRVIPRAKIKTMKMSLTIVLAFICLWTPYFVVYNIRIFSDYNTNIPEWLLSIVETLALMNSAVNPIIYGCFNIRVRQGLQEVCFNLNKHSDKSQRMSEPPTASTSSAIIFKGFRAPQQLIRGTFWPSKQKKHRHYHGHHGQTMPGSSRPETGNGLYDFAQSTRHIQNKRSQTLQRLQAEKQLQQQPSTSGSCGSLNNKQNNNRPLNTFRKSHQPFNSSPMVNGSTSTTTINNNINSTTKIIENPIVITTACVLENPVETCHSIIANNLKLQDHDHNFV